jgi:hypothetical protein
VHVVPDRCGRNDADCSGNHNVRFWEASIETFIGGCASIAQIDGV